jgi:hypothetical protein
VNYSIPDFWGNLYPQGGSLNYEGRNTYERAESEDKSRATYVQFIRDVAFVLRISENEAEVIKRTVEAPSPFQLARLFYSSPVHLPVIGANSGSGLEHYVRGSDR